LPTFERLQRFDRDFDVLTPEQQHRFREAVAKFVEDLTRGEGFLKGLRVKGVKGSKGIYEMTWADDGRATFSYGDSVRKGEPHVIWHRVGAHAVLGDPKARP
jgi:hypothetical protein